MSTHHKIYKLKGFSSCGKILWSCNFFFFKKLFFQKLKSVPIKKLTTFWQWSWVSFLKITSKSKHSLLSYLVRKLFYLKSLTYDLDLELWPLTLKILSVLCHDPGHLSLKFCPNPICRFWVIASTSCFYVSASSVFRKITTTPICKKIEIWVHSFECCIFL